MIKFTVIGIPKGQGRPRTFQQKNGTITSYSPKTDWFGLVHAEAVKNRPAVPLDGPLHMDIVFAMPKPKSARKAETFASKRPDLDNLVKAIMDACNNAQLWVDDARVSSMKIAKNYGEPAGAQISIEKLEAI